VPSLLPAPPQALPKKPALISLTAEYALRAVVCLANAGGTLLTARELSETAGLPRDYTSKVLTDLVRAGLVRGRRGIGGGYALIRPPEELTTLDVVDAVDPIRRIEVCPLDRPGHENLCPLHRRIDHVAVLAREAFASTTIAELLEEEGKPPLCQP
jgi:Rrf2 family transcriptional regulator, nitric oxide-sensitive transcriptional repressor